MNFEFIDILLSNAFVEKSSTIPTITQYSTNVKIRVAFEDETFHPERVILILSNGATLPAKALFLSKDKAMIGGRELYYYEYDFTQYETEKFVERLGATVNGYDDNGRLIGSTVFEIPMEKSDFAKISPSYLEDNNSVNNMITKVNDYQAQLNVISRDHVIMQDELSQIPEFTELKIAEGIESHNSSDSAHDSKFKNYFTKTESDNKYQTIQNGVTKAELTEHKNDESAHMYIQSQIPAQITTHNASLMAHQDIRDKIGVDIITHNISNNSHRDIRNELAEVRSLAEGRINAISFETLLQLDNWLDGDYERPDGIRPSDLVLGQNIYVTEEGSPDFWVSKVPVYSRKELTELETAKVDLSDYYTKEQVNSEFVDNTELTSAISAHDRSLDVHNEKFLNYYTKNEVESRLQDESRKFIELAGRISASEVIFEASDLTPSALNNFRLTLDDESAVNLKDDMIVTIRPFTSVVSNKTPNGELLRIRDLKQFQRLGSIKPVGSTNEIETDKDFLIWEFTAYNVESSLFIFDLYNETALSMSGEAIDAGIENQTLIPGTTIVCTTSYEGKHGTFFFGRLYLVNGAIQRATDGTRLDLALELIDLTGKELEGFTKYDFATGDLEWKLGEDGVYTYEIISERDPVSIFERANDGSLNQISFAQMNYSNGKITIRSSTPFTGQVLACGAFTEDVSTALGSIDTNNTTSLPIPTSPESLLGEVKLHQIAKTGSWHSLKNIPLVSSWSTTPSDSNIASEKLVYDTIEDVRSSIDTSAGEAIAGVQAQVNTHNSEIAALKAKDTSIDGSISNLSTRLDQQVSTLTQSIASGVSESKSYTDTKVAALVNGAPGTLDTLDELAAALQDNADIIETINASISNKADKATVPTKLSDLSQDSTHRLVTDSEKSTWNNKLDASSLSASLPTKLPNPESLGITYIGSLASGVNTTTYYDGSAAKSITIPYFALNGAIPAYNAYEWYAPTASGTAGQVLKSQGANKAPVWGEGVSDGAAAFLNEEYAKSRGNVIGKSIMKAGSYANTTTTYTESTGTYVVNSSTSNAYSIYYVNNLTVGKKYTVSFYTIRQTYVPNARVRLGTSTTDYTNQAYGYVMADSGSTRHKITFTATSSVLSFVFYVAGSQWATGDKLTVKEITVSEGPDALPWGDTASEIVHRKELLETVDVLEARLDAMGFKEGVISWASFATSDNNVTIKKLGKYAFIEANYLQFYIDANSYNQDLAVGNIPEGMRPKTDIIDLEVLYKGTDGTASLVRKISIKTNGDIIINSTRGTMNYLFRYWYEIA